MFVLFSDKVATYDLNRFHLRSDLAYKSHFHLPGRYSLHLEMRDFYEVPSKLRVCVTWISHTKSTPTDLVSKIFHYL